MQDDDTANTVEQQKPSSLTSTVARAAKGATTSAGLTQFMTPKEIQEALECSRASAYRHVRRASGKTGRGLLRVAFEDWERYIGRKLRCGSSETEKPGTRISRLEVSDKGGARAARTGKRPKLSLDSGNAIWLIRPTQPRRKRPSATQ